MEYSIPFSNEDYKRYSRHFIVADMQGCEGMKKLKESHIAVFGAGGLGCPLTTYLVGAGVGKLTIVDNDTIDYSNLSRQVAYTVEDVGSNKVDVLSKRLKLMNPNVEINPICERFNESNFNQYLDKSFTVIADCTDNIETRYLINELALKLNLPLVSAGALIWGGQLTVYNHRNSPCFRCFFPNPPKGPVINRSCDQDGVIGAVVGTLGCLQGLEVLKVILDLPTTLSSKILTFDGLYGNFQIFETRKRLPNCPSCSNDETLRVSYREKLTPTKCLADYSSPVLGYSVSVKDLNNIVTATANDSNIKSYIIIDVREPHEYSMIYFKNAINIPLSTLIKCGFNAITHLLHKDITEIYVLCHRGIRSVTARDMLDSEKKQAGYEHVQILNVIGGMDRWSTDVDSSLPRY